MGDGKYFLDRLGIKTAADETSRQALIKALQKAHATSQSPDGLVTNHCSLTIYSSELTVFMGYEDKEMLAALCDLFDCKDRFLKDTVGRGEEEVPNVWLNLLGATTPAQLQASVPQGFVGSGFTSRIIFVYEEDKAKMVIKPSLSPEQLATQECLLQDLDQIRGMCGEFSTDQLFENEYTRWRTAAEAKSPFDIPQLEYYNQRRPLHLFKLCMIHSASRASDFHITVDDLNRAIFDLEEAETKMHNVFVGLGANPLAGVQYRIRKLLDAYDSIPLSHLAVTFESDVSFSQLGEALASLEQMGFCSIDAVNKRLVRRKNEHRPSSPKHRLPSEGAGNTTDLRGGQPPHASVLHPTDVRGAGETIPEDENSPGNPPEAAVPEG